MSYNNPPFFTASVCVVLLYCTTSCSFKNVKIGVQIWLLFWSLEKKKITKLEKKENLVYTTVVMSKIGLSAWRCFVYIPYSSVDIVTFVLTENPVSLGGRLQPVINFTTKL